MINKAKTLMEAQDIEVMLIHSPENFIYASGIYNATMRMNMEEGLLNQFVILPRESEPTLLIDSGVLETAEEASWIRDIRTISTSNIGVFTNEHKVADSIVNMSTARRLNAPVAYSNLRKLVGSIIKSPSKKIRTRDIHKRGKMLKRKIILTYLGFYRKIFTAGFGHEY